MPTTPEEWLPILAAQLDAQIDETKKLRDYCAGRPPLPEMGPNLQDAWKAFQKKARLDYGGLAVRALKSRIRCRAVTVPGDDTANVQAARIFRDNRLGHQFGLAVVDRLETGRGYLVVGLDEGQAVVTREKPEHFTVRTDALKPWRVTQALKVSRDDVAGRDTALVWVEGQRQRFERASKSDGVKHVKAVGDWQPVGEPEPYTGRPPIVSLEREAGSFIAPHLDLIDGIVLGKLQRLVIVALQAFRQRALKLNKDAGDLPKEDDDGNDIDYGKLFEPHPGALWELPAGVDIWESAVIDTRPLLEGEKADRRDFAAVTSTPLSVFVPDGANQSAEGAANAKEGHISIAEDELLELGPALALLMVYALRAEGVDLGDATVEPDFAPPALVSLSEKYAAASQAKGAGLARRTVLKEVLGMSPDEIAEDEVALADEQLNAFIAAGGATDGAV